MSSPSDLTPVLTFAAAQASDIGFHQGVVVAWDESLGTNTVNVAGTLLENLPCLNLGEFVILAPDDIVGILRFQHTYFILGRIVLPAGPDSNRASVAFDGATGFQANFTVPTDFAVRASATITVPPWADEAIVMATTSATVRNSQPARDFAQCITEIDGIGGGSMLNTFEAGVNGLLVSSCQVLLPSPGPTITVQSLLKTDAGSTTWTADPFNLCIVTSIAMFRRVN